MAAYHRHDRFAVLITALTLTAGCGTDRLPAVAASVGPVAPPVGRADSEKTRPADVNVLYVGNSHTAMHNLPNLVGEMIRFRHPETTVDAHQVGVGFLEDVARDSRCREAIESRPWTYVVLQAQKESRTGRYNYSQAEGIEIAKLAKDRGATVVFYAEWGLRDVPGHGPRIEKVYREMAAAAGARVAPVGRAWDLALADRPDLSLHDADGNHQTALGAFLTACVLFGRLTGENPAVLASFPYPAANEADRRFLAAMAARAIEQAKTETADGGKPRNENTHPHD